MCGHSGINGGPEKHDICQVQLLTIGSCDALLATRYLPAVTIFEENDLRLSVVTVGSEGDTRPLAALCRGLLDRGHEVRLDRKSVV